MLTSGDLYFLENENNVNTVKLPKILLTIDGIPLLWEGFWKNFDVSVENQTLSDVQKPCYL